jgi:hypothetical protein
MRKLQQLTTFLKTQLNLEKPLVTSFADKGSLDRSTRDLGHGIELGRWRYDAVIQIEEFSGNADVLLLLILGWLEDNDPDRDELDLADPEIDVSEIDDRTSDVDIAVEFEEGLQIVPDDNGPIPYNGRKWRVAEVPIDVAEELESLESKPDATE